MEEKDDKQVTGSTKDSTSATSTGKHPEKYRRLKVLGKGSFGKAYLVQKTESGQLCVIKQMETTMMSEQERQEAIKEAHVLKKMNHPNIVKFHEVFMTRRGRLCIVMDYADGGDIHLLIKKREGALIPESQILNWFVQTALALKHVHDRKVLHRDLKSQNIFLTSSGVVKLGDFGIARMLEATKDFARTMVGTPYYLSPEIIEERPYNFKSDIWSLGVVLYEMTTLRHPFDAESLHFLAIKILKGTFPPPDPKYSSDLVSLIKAMLNRDPEKRPSALEVLRQAFLRPYLEQVARIEHLDLDKELSPTPVDYHPQQRKSISTPSAEAAAASSAAPQAPSQPQPAPAPVPAPPAQPQVLQPPQPSSSSSRSRKQSRSTTRTNSEPGDPEPDMESEDEGGDGGARKPSAAHMADVKLPTARQMSGMSVSQQHNAKAESLRQYLQSMLTAAEYDKAYGIVRSSNAGGEADGSGGGGGDLMVQLKEVIGPQKAKSLLELFQLLVFLEDIATSTEEAANA